MENLYKYENNKEIKSYVERSFPEFNDYLLNITFSAEIPPILQSLIDFKSENYDEELTEYPIDQLMGAYSHETKSIVIYLLGIHLAAKQLKSRINVSSLYADLLHIVLLHEIGHYWFYNVKISKDLRFSGADIEPIKDKKVDEWIAQMFAYFCLKENTNLTMTMSALAEHQPEDYRFYKKYQPENIQVFKLIVRQIHLSDSADQTYKKLIVNDIIKRYKEYCDYNL